MVIQVKYGFVNSSGSVVTRKGEREGGRKRGRERRRRERKEDNGRKRRQKRGGKKLKIKKIRKRTER